MCTKELLTAYCLQLCTYYLLLTGDLSLPLPLASTPPLTLTPTQTLNPNPNPNPNPAGNKAGAIGCPPATLKTNKVTLEVLLQHLEEGRTLTAGELACVRAGNVANGAHCASKLLVTSYPHPSPYP